MEKDKFFDKENFDKEIQSENIEEFEDIEILSEEEAEEELKKRMGSAEKLLNDEDKLRKFLIKLEKKLKLVPRFGDKLSKVPLMASFVSDWARKKYVDVPVGTIVAVLSALIYFVSPIDFIPDSIPFFGFLDDAAVVVACLRLVESDLEDYIKWRENNE